MSEAASPPTSSIPRAIPDVPGRATEADVDPIFVDRHSTRVFSEAPVAPETLRSVLEAARWAPSSANSQPWLFVTASTPAGRQRLGNGLMEMNRRWALHAPVLMYLFTRVQWESGPYAGAPHSHSDFDAGAAWMSLALQAHRLGLSAHAMGGVHRDRMAEIAGVDPAVFRPLIAIALGYPAPTGSIPEEMRARERPTPRRPMAEIVRSVESTVGPGAIVPAGPDGGLP
jgi:nitroreductase